MMEASTKGINPTIRTLVRLANALETNIFSLMQPPTAEELTSLTAPKVRARAKNTAKD
jgi:hypothetical protein